VYREVFQPKKHLQDFTRSRSLGSGEFGTVRHVFYSEWMDGEVDSEQVHRRVVHEFAMKTMPLDVPHKLTAVVTEIGVLIHAHDRPIEGFAPLHYLFRDGNNVHLLLQLGVLDFLDFLRDTCQILKAR
jgi:hypothetical protein